MSRNKKYHLNTSVNKFHIFPNISMVVPSAASVNFSSLKNFFDSLHSLLQH